MEMNKKKNVEYFGNMNIAIHSFHAKKKRVIRAEKKAGIEKYDDEKFYIVEIEKRNFNRMARNRISQVNEGKKIHRNFQ